MREALCKNTADAISHVQHIMKDNTDKTHQEFMLKVRERAFICLNIEYHLPGIQKAKIRQQHVRPFKVEAVMGMNTYKLKLLST